MSYIHRNIFPFLNKTQHSILDTFFITYSFHILIQCNSVDFFISYLVFIILFIISFIFFFSKSTIIKIFFLVSEFVCLFGCKYFHNISGEFCIHV